MSFQSFCTRMATPDTIPDQLVESDKPFNDDIATRVNSLCDIMMNKMNILDRVNVSFIESAMEDPARVEFLMNRFNMNPEDPSTAGNVPDDLLIVFSRRLYQKEFHQLTAEQQSIIKILSVYICISTQDGD